MHIPVSAGSIFNFNKEAYEGLASFEQWTKTRLARSDLMHADETGNVPMPCAMPTTSESWSGPGNKISNSGLR